MIWRVLCGLTFVSLTTSAAAETLATGDQLRGFIDVRTGVADGERSWIDEGMGKTRFNGGGDDFHPNSFANAMLIWRPHLTWNLDGYLTLQADTQVEPHFDVVEAYLSYRGAPRAHWRWSARAGLMYPPVSLEHDGPGWTPTNTITPSAVNSWIGEEVKVLGAEATARRELGEQEISLTAALFGFNDTAGTALAFRGWALGDFLPGVSGDLPMPERSFPYQESSRPTTELDDRVGYYARLEYKPTGPITLDVMHYDNAGDRRSDEHGQTDWETRFTNIGLRAILGEHTRLLAQIMRGETIWGMSDPVFGYWTDVDFTAGYLLIAHDFGRQSLAARLDLFEVTDNSYQAVDNNDEEGWAATAAYQFHLTPAMRLAFEGLHVSSDRPTRTDQGLAPRQEQTTVQSSLKFSF